MRAPVSAREVAAAGQRRRPAGVVGSRSSSSAWNAGIVLRVEEGRLELLERRHRGFPARRRRRSRRNGRRISMRASPRAGGLAAPRRRPQSLPRSLRPGAASTPELTSSAQAPTRAAPRALSRADAAGEDQPSPDRPGAAIRDQSKVRPVPPSGRWTAVSNRVRSAPARVSGTVAPDRTGRPDLAALRQQRRAAPRYSRIFLAVELHRVEPERACALSRHRLRPSRSRNTPTIAMPICAPASASCRARAGSTARGVCGDHDQAAHRWRRPLRPPSRSSWLSVRPQTLTRPKTSARAAAAGSSARHQRRADQEGVGMRREPLDVARGPRCPIRRRAAGRPAPGRRAAR